MMSENSGKFIVLIILSFIFYSCEKIDYSEPTYIDGGYPLNVNKKKNAIYFGVVPYKNTIEMAYEYNGLLKYLSERTNQKIVYLPMDQYYKVKMELGAKKLSIGIIDPLIYQRNKDLDIEIIAKFKLKDNLKFSTFIVARNDKTIKKDEEFYDYTIALDNPESFFGYHLPMQLFQRDNKRISNFKNLFFSSNMENIAYGVLTGNFDLGAIDTYNYYKFKNRAIGLKVIYQSENFEPYPVVVLKSLDQNLKKELRSALLEIKDIDILKLIDPNLIGFEPASEADYSKMNF